MQHEDHLQGARRAIEIERAHATEVAVARVREVRQVEERVYAVDIDCDVPLDPTGWTGGALARRLTDGVSAEEPIFRAEILEVDADADTLFVEVAPGAQIPTPGSAVIFPHDFLRAPWALLTEPRFAALQRRLGDALAGVLGDELALEVEGPAGLAPAWAHDRVLVWGPPGTGKTWTIVEQVAVLLNDPTERILLVSTTNRATDELALRLGRRLGGGARGLVRLGTVVRPEEYQREGLQTLLPAYDQDLLAAMSAARERLQEARSPGARAAALRTLRELQEGLPTLATRARDPSDRCVVTTLHAALNAVVADEIAKELEAGRAPFTTLVLDEAGLVGRAQTAAASLLASRRVVLVGDPRQLSPIAKAARSMPPDVRRWVARSGLDRLETDSRGPELQRLTEQHRMHPEIRAVVSQLAYAGALTDAPSVTDRPWGDARLARLPRASWYVLDEHTDRPPLLHSERGPGGVSRQRPLALAVIDALLGLHPRLRREDVLFITPYRAQVQLVREGLRHRGLSSWRASTVHAQQGAEADVVLFDTVHASSTTWPADEWTRLVNVGLSRARHLVWLLASRAEMDQPFLRALRRDLAAMVVRKGAWEQVGRVQPGVDSLFVPRPPAALPAPAEPPAPPPDDDRLGAQLARRQALRPLMSQEQARLVHRELTDAGPRLVRGVAGSGKTLVLAHWAVRALHGLRVREVVIVYANRALRSLLESVLEQVWSSLYPAPGAVPWERIQLLHVGDLVRDLLLERDLPPPGAAGEDPYNYDAQARRVLDAGGGDRRFPAVFVDEAQDLGHDTLRLLIALTAPEPDGARPIMVFYDNAQNVYGRRAPRWKELGLDLRGRSDVMKESFRSTRPNTELALDVLDRLRPLEKDPDLRELLSGDEPLLHKDADGWWQARFCAVDGQAPAVRIFEDREDELRTITEQVRRWIHRDGVRPGDIRVLAFKNTRDALVARLRAALSPVRVEDRRSQGFADSNDAVVVTTPHSFKGYDAELIVVAGVDGYCSGGEVLHAPLYVALTRARTLLFATATRAAGGPSAALVRALEAAGARWRR